MEKNAVVIWRDSVAAGDDVDAPHEWVMQLPPNATFKVRYWCQEDPQRVYSRLRTAAPLPAPRGH